MSLGSHSFTAIYTLLCLDVLCPYEDDERASSLYGPSSFLRHRLPTHTCGGCVPKAGWFILLPSLHLFQALTPAALSNVLRWFLLKWFHFPFFLCWIHPERNKYQTTRLYSRIQKLQWSRPYRALTKSENTTRSIILLVNFVKPVHSTRLSRQLVTFTTRFPSSSNSENADIYSHLNMFVGITIDERECLFFVVFDAKLETPSQRAKIVTDHRSWSLDESSGIRRTTFPLFSACS